MFAKLAAVILGIGAVGCGLLALRQQRLEAASELARLQVHIRAQDEHLWKLRAEIAERVSPGQVREMAAGIGPLHPLVPIASRTTAESVRARLVAPAQKIQDAPPLPQVPDPRWAGSKPVPLPPTQPAPTPRPARKSAPTYAQAERQR